MRKVWAILAIGIFLHININAMAEGEKPVPLDPQEKKILKHKNAEKIMAFMRVAGMHSATLQDVAYFVDERSEDGYFKIHEEKIGGINMQFRYDMGGLHKENFEVNFRPEDSNLELNANPEKVMFRYRAEF
jgi:hypothetical protein